MTERSEVHVTVVCSPRSGESVTGARSVQRDPNGRSDWIEHQ
jgi:hypothetical protein